MNGLLDNIVWHTLTGPHSRYAVGTDVARRYARGFSPIVGFLDGERPDFAALVPHCEPGEHFYCDGWNGPAPSNWCIDAESTMFKMVFEHATPPNAEMAAWTIFDWQGDEPRGAVIDSIPRLPAALVRRRRVPRWVEERALMLDSDTVGHHCV